MSKEYYTIIRKYYGLPDYLNTDLSKRKIALLLIRSMKQNNVYEICLKMVDGWKMKNMEKKDIM